MAVWTRFLRDVDYQHKSRAVTAYKAGMVVYLPNHIAHDDQLLGATEPSDKPDSAPVDGSGEADGRRVYLTDERDSFTEN